ncbi:hypothetical protein TgHK011_007716 [Trichoderma gracile]|nr:hypothetical protein TgHK011_007716 [Trichoderma gracile]
MRYKVRGPADVVVSSLLSPPPRGLSCRGQSTARIQRGLALPGDITWPKYRLKASILLLCLPSRLKRGARPSVMPSSSLLSHSRPRLLASRISLLAPFGLLLTAVSRLLVSSSLSFCFPVFLFSHALELRSRTPDRFSVASPPQNKRNKTWETPSPRSPQDWLKSAAAAAAAASRSIPLVATHWTNHGKAACSKAQPSPVLSDSHCQLLPVEWCCCQYTGQYRLASEPHMSSPLGSLRRLVQEATGGFSSPSDSSRSESCPAAQQDVAALVTEMGDYLARTAMIWSCLIQSLIQGPHIDLVTLQILQKSKADTRVADLSASVSMDVTLSRLRKMRDLAEQYSRDVQAVWRIGCYRKPSPSCTRASPASHDGPPSVAPSVTSPVSSSEPQTVPEEPDGLSHAPKRRKQLPDAAAPRERQASAPHPPLPPLPLLPPASSLLLPPILSDGADCAGAAPTNNASPRQPPTPAKPPSKAAVRRETAAKPLLISSPMMTIPPPAAAAAGVSASVATSESAATPPAAESPISVTTPASDATPAAATPVEQDDSDDYSDENQFAGINMKALKQRGKGKYYCPRGHHCDKGGVDKQGNLVLFDRNSSFAQHCNKHRKPWRCDVPGCPNPPKKRRFARRDGLERHKATVKHYFMTYEYDVPTPAPAPALSSIPMEGIPKRSRKRVGEAGQDAVPTPAAVPESAPCLVPTPSHWVDRAITNLVVGFLC